MSSYLISGPNGTGKSTVGRVLQSRGFRVIETDTEPGVSAWFDNASGQKVNREDMPEYPVPAKWLAAHSWLWDRAKMNELFASVGPEPTFFVGGAYNEHEFMEDFYKRFALHTTNENIKTRLQSEERGEGNRWVDGSPSLLGALDWNSRFVHVSKANGAILIDSTPAPDSIADTILTYIQTP
jgi:hypothetical protein